MSTEATPVPGDKLAAGRMNNAVPPMLARSLAAFRRDLPTLLERHRRRWVAYHGDQRLDFGRTQTELYEKYLARGLKIDEFLVCRIEPEIADEDITWSSSWNEDDEK